MSFGFIRRERSGPSTVLPGGLRPRTALSRLLLGAATLAGLACGAPAVAKTSLEVPLVVTQVPAGARATPAGADTKGLVRGDWFEGARLVVVSPAGQARVLSEGFDSACDPDVSFDGQRVLFAGRKEPQDRWRIWEIGLDGQGLRPVTPATIDARSPRHVSTLFTLNSPEPWFTLVFVGREPAAAANGRPAVANLYNIRLDGGDLRRLTYTPDHSLDPFQMWDGRVVYAAEHRPHEPSTAGGRLALRAIHIEGADMEAYGGGLGRRVQQMPCATAGGLVVFIESDAPAPDGSGQLAAVEEQRPHQTYRVLQKDASRRYLHPSPLQGNQLLVAQRDARNKGTWAIVRFDADTGTVAPVFDTHEYHEVQAVAVQPRPRPDGHSTVVTTEDNYGTLYGLDCYTADAARAGRLQPGEVKRVRLLEGVPTAPGVPAARRLVGEAPVEADGSFNVVVPADTPLLLQTLDDQGLALGTCGWIWVKPKETRGCIGCHEDPELVPQNSYVLALRRPSNRLVLPAADRRTVTFRDDVAPILAQHCATAACHGGTDTPLTLPLGAAAPAAPQLRQAYQALTAGPRPLVEAGRARTSPLVWQLLGRDTSRPWDPAAPPAQKITRMPHANAGTTLTPEQVRTLIQWIDLGAAFDPAGTENTGK